MLKKYKKKENQFITAINCDIAIDGFTYNKWGAEQKCDSGDWLVDNNGDIYTVDKKTFAQTYKKIDTGRYIKTTPVWAEEAQEDGNIKTQEGTSQYSKGDFIVYNNKDKTDSYAIKKQDFFNMYEEVD